MKKKKRKKGITLIEMLVAVGIVSLLAAIALVSMKNYGSRARAAKLLGSLNSAVSGMQNCWNFSGGDVVIPSSGSNICNLGSAQLSIASQYGKWPNLSLIGSDYSYLNDTNNNNCADGNCNPLLGFLPRSEPEKNYTYDNGFFVKKAQAAFAPPPSTSGCFQKSGWYFAAGSVSDNVKVCCNNTINGCTVISSGTNCDSTIN
jgi:prepilin-type N-terminal cleavage/methylation domain-containing protein